MQTHVSIISLVTWKLCIISMPRCFSTPHPQTSASLLPTTTGQQASLTVEFQVVLASGVSASTISCETTLNTNKQVLLTHQKETKMEKNEIGAKRLREERCSHSIFGQAHGGVCLSEQLHVSGEPGFCTSSLHLGNLILVYLSLNFSYLSLNLWVKMFQVKTSHFL